MTHGPHLAALHPVSGALPLTSNAWGKAALNAAGCICQAARQHKTRGPQVSLPACPPSCEILQHLVGEREHDAPRGGLAGKAPGQGIARLACQVSNAQALGDHQGTLQNAKQSIKSTFTACCRVCA